MRRSLKGILARIDQLALRAQAVAPAVDIAAILIEGRRCLRDRQRTCIERGYGETAAERYARHVQQKPTISVEDSPIRQAWFWKRQIAIWTRLNAEYTAEAAREAGGFALIDEPSWWSKSEEALRESARRNAASSEESVTAAMVAESLIEMRRQRPARQASARAL
jgi:hypothetical protein